MNKIVEFWLLSWRTDKIAFVFEMISFIFIVGASFALAINAQNPRLEYIYPAFFIGSLTAVYAYFRRKLVWPMLLTFYFVFVNIFGFGRSMGWW